MCGCVYAYMRSSLCIITIITRQGEEIRNERERVWGSKVGQSLPRRAFAHPHL